MMVVQHGLDGLGQQDLTHIHASSVDEGRAIANSFVARGLLAPGSRVTLHIHDGRDVAYYPTARGELVETPYVPPPEPEPPPVVTVEPAVVTTASTEAATNGANGNGSPVSVCPAGQQWSDLINRCYVVGQEDPQEIAAWWERQQAAPDVTAPAPSLITADTRVPVPPVPTRGPRPPLYQDFEDCIPGDQDCIDRNAARAAANQAILTNHGNEYLKAQCERANALNINAGHPELARDCTALFPIVQVPLVPSAIVTPFVATTIEEAAVSVPLEARTVADEAGLPPELRADSGTTFQIPSGITEVLTGEVIGGVPNWLLAVGVAAGLLLLKGGR